MCMNAELVAGVGQEKPMKQATEAYDKKYGKYVQSYAGKATSLKMAYQTVHPISVKGK